jgi:N-acyl-D-amino-acid deacylase
MILAEPLHEPKVRQGITTEVIGVDGNSYAPFAHPGGPRRVRPPQLGLDGDPRRTHKTKIDWTTVASYLARFDGAVSLNIAYLIGNSPLRIQAVGWEDVPATPGQRARWRPLLKEGMEEGAFGLSSGLDYPPGSYATTGELAELTKEAGRHGGFYHTHVRYSLGDRFLDPFREAIEIGRLGEAPAHITHFYHRKTFPGSPDRMLDLVDAARREGLDVTFDAYPPIGPAPASSSSSRSGSRPAARSGRRSASPTRTSGNRIRRELQDRGTLFAGAGGLRDVRIGYLHRKELLAWEGKTPRRADRRDDSDPVDTLCDLLLAEDLSPNEVTPGPHIDGIRRFLQAPDRMVGTDSTFVGEKPSPRTYGSFPGSSASSSRTRRCSASRRRSGG